MRRAARRRRFFVSRRAPPWIPQRAALDPVGPALCVSQCATLWQVVSEAPLEAAPVPEAYSP